MARVEPNVGVGDQRVAGRGLLLLLMACVGIGAEERR